MQEVQENVLIAIIELEEQLLMGEMELMDCPSKAQVTYNTQQSANKEQQSKTLADANQGERQALVLATHFVPRQSSMGVYTNLTKDGKLQSKVRPRFLSNVLRVALSEEEIWTGVKDWKAPLTISTPKRTKICSV
jgi:hypothetical protein